jgi:hypothetical protein
MACCVGLWRSLKLGILAVQEMFTFSHVESIDSLLAIVADVLAISVFKYGPVEPIDKLAVTDDWVGPDQSSPSSHVFSLTFIEPYPFFSICFAN